MTPEECKTLDDVRGILRRCVGGPMMCVADASQVEARMLLWLACDEEGLGVYRRGEDPYCRAAERIYGLPPYTVPKKGDPRRQAGKVATLALGFSGGVGALLRMAAKLRAELVGVTPTAVVEGWRDMFPLVAGVRTGYEYVADPTDEEPDPLPVQERRGGLWRELEAGFKRAAQGGQATCAAGRVSYHAEGGLWGGTDVVCLLPSGREIRYRDVRTEDVPGLDGLPKPTLTFATPRGSGKRASVWRGILVENVVQAACRDLMVWVALRLESEGFPPVLHVHDEVVVEVPDESALPAVLALCEVEPPWAEGFPLAAAGAAGTRWSK